MVESPLPEAIEGEITRLLDEPPAAFWSGIERLCAVHPDLARLIRATARGARALAEPEPRTAADLGGDCAASRGDAADVARGDRIGPFLVLERIGEGGMGVVYLADQREPVKRRVALKVIKLGMDTRAVLARFEAERQALALMDHPCIAKVLEAGTTPTGRPYFAMEYVRGVPITRYCDDHRLSLDDRLGLFKAVCAGVQHAHTKGVVHRDLTPNNVLVTLQDGAPTPKIIDFGLARATDHRLTEKTLYTEQGLILGTPEYMSPEQAGLQALDIDMRSDVYTLGVLLYELLTGALPFDAKALRTGGYESMCRTIRESDPPRPSTKVTLHHAGPATAARLRRTDVRTLLRRLRGDLDWIVLKCLEKDRTRRYQTVSHLADDVQRHLDSEPVLARAPSVGYRLAKFARRHRGRLVAGAAALVLLLGALALATTFWLDARAQAKHADRSAAEAVRQKAIAEERARDAEQQRAEVERQRQAIEERGYVAAIRAAASGIEHGELLDVRSALASCPAALRGFEWHHLQLASSLTLKTAVAGPPPTTGFAAREDGAQFAVATGDRVVRVFDGTTGEVVASLRPGGASVTALAFCAPERLAIGCADGALLVADLRDLSVQRVGGIGTQVVVVVGAGDALWTGSRDGCLRRWQRGAATAIERWPGEVVFSLAVHVASGQFAASGTMERIMLGDQASDRLSGAPLVGHVDSVVALAFSPDGSRLVSGSLDRRVMVWDTEAHECLAALRGHELPVTSVAFSADGGRCASGSTDNTVRLWDVEAGRPLAVLLGHTSRLVGVAFLRASGRLVSVDVDGNLCWWDPAVFGPSMELAGHLHWVRSLSVAPDGACYVSGSEKSDGTAGEVFVWRADTGERLRTLYDDDRPVHAVLHGGAWIAAGLRDGTVAFFDARADAAPAFVRVASQPVTELALGAGGSQLAAAHGDGITVLDTVRRQPVARIVAGGRVGALASSADGTRIVWGEGERVCLRDWGGGDVATLAADVGTVLAVALDPAGRRLAVAGSLANARVLDIASGTALVLRGHRGEIHAVAFDPSGRRILTASRDCTLRIWDADRGECLLVLRGHAFAVVAAAFSPDGARIVSASDDTTIRIWESREGPLRALWAHRER